MRIAFLGGAGVGKSSADNLTRELLGVPDCAHTSFATALRRIAVELWGPDAANDRELLQWLGVTMRERDPDVWVRLWTQNVETWIISNKYITVDDLRFPNEYWAAAELGFVFVRMEADLYTRIDRLKANGKWSEGCLEHESETSLPADEYPADYTITNDGTLNELADQLVPIVNALQRKDR